MQKKQNTITLEALSEENFRDVFDFERINRNFFEQTLSPRPAGYFIINSFKNIITELLKEQEEGKASLYILRNSKRKMVGRINLTFLERGDQPRAEVGYRIGQDDLKKGYATEGLRQLCEMTFKTFSNMTLEAGTSTTNYGSQKVLENNGFTLIGIEKRVMKINDKWVDGILYKRENFR